MPIAIVTGASKGLGAALAHGLARQGWSLVVDARGALELARSQRSIRPDLVDGATLVAIDGDVADPVHRLDLIAAAVDLGGIDLLVNNASTLGPVPMPALTELAVEDLAAVLEVNLLAPLALVQAARAALVRSPDPRVLNVTSDASVEAYEGWGGYGSSKAALDHLSAVLAVENPGIRVWAVDPGDMRTDMHQQAFLGEDISDRPLPDAVVPGLLELINGDRPSGRYRVADLVAAGVGGRP
jgi:NAD(P)-dependent dehydrogenase (short-subunit alcohol dehydrogenase family)